MGLPFAICNGSRGRGRGRTTESGGLAGVAGSQQEPPRTTQKKSAHAPHAPSQRRCFERRTSSDLGHPNLGDLRVCCAVLATSTVQRPTSSYTPTHRRRRRRRSMQRGGAVSRVAAAAAAAAAAATGWLVVGSEGYGAAAKFLAFRSDLCVRACGCVVDGTRMCASIRVVLCNARRGEGVNTVVCTWSNESAVGWLVRLHT